MTKRIPALLSLFILILLVSSVHAQPRVPTLDDLLTLKSVGGTQISPDGKWVAYTVGYGDFKQDAFITQIWLADSGSGKTIQLTRGDKSSTNPHWSPDGRWLAFLSNRIEDKNQIFLIDPTGGEAQQLTKSETAISNFAWSEDGKSIAYTATEPTAQPQKDRKDYYGDYDVVREGYSYVHLWTIDVADAVKSLTAADSNAASADEKNAKAEAVKYNAILDGLESGVTPADVHAAHQGGEIPEPIARGFRLKSGKDKPKPQGASK